MACTRCGGCVWRGEGIVGCIILKRSLFLQFCALGAMFFSRHHLFPSFSFLLVCSLFLVLLLPVCTYLLHVHVRFCRVQYIPVLLPVFVDWFLICGRFRQ